MPPAVARGGVFYHSNRWIISFQSVGGLGAGFGIGLDSCTGCVFLVRFVVAIVLTPKVNAPEGIPQGRVNFMRSSCDPMDIPCSQTP